MIKKLASVAHDEIQFQEGIKKKLKIVLDQK